MNSYKKQIVTNGRYIGNDDLERSYLAHFGIKFRSGRYKYGSGDRPYQHDPSKSADRLYDDNIRNTQYNEDVSYKVFNKIGGNKQILKECDKAIDEKYKKYEAISKDVNGLFKELDKDRETKDYYEATSEVAEYIIGGYLGDADNFTVDSLGNAVFIGVYEDGQQGTINAYSMFADEKGIIDEVKDLSREIQDTDKVVSEKNKQLIKDELIRCGVSDTKDRTVDGLASNIAWKKDNSREPNWQKITGIFNMNYGAANVLDFDQDHRNAIKKAKEWTSHLDNNPDTWWMLTEAAENLGYSNVPCKDLSDSDWNKINAEIRRLRSEEGKGF